MPSLVSNHFELDSVSEVPETYSWPAAATDDHPVSSDPFPVVDLADPEATAKLARACEVWGAFQLPASHGVPVDLLDRLESQLLRLFSLPTEQKLKAAQSKDSVFGYGVVPIANFFSKRMWSEGFTFAGSPLEHALKIWPDDPSQFCDVVDDYDREMKKLAMRLMHLMLTSLGVGDGDMKCTSLAEDSLTGAVRLNSYPACPDPDRAMGMAAHSDSSLITILYQNGTTGLQVLRPGDESGPARWATAPAVHGSLIVILGDLFQILTNGRFRSAYHRAVVNRSRRRLSAAYFCGPAPTAEVAPVGKLVDPGHGPCYRAVTWPEFRDIKAKLFQEALDSLKMQPISIDGADD